MDLDTPVALTDGDDFYVHLELSGGGHAYDRTSDIPVLLGAPPTDVIVESASHPGESYYRSGSTWLDLYNFNDTANFCIKALANERRLRISPAEGLSSKGPAGGPFVPSDVVYELKNINDQPINYEVTVDPAADWVTLSGDICGTLAPLGTASVIVDINSYAETLDEGAYLTTLYFTNTTDHAGDTTRPVRLAVGASTLQYGWKLDSEPGPAWTTEADWAWGQPTGNGGEYGGPDPTSGHTGNNVYGYNLNGDYPNYLPEEHLTSSAINCAGLYDVHLNFWRWLGVEKPMYDHAYIRVSNNGTDWVTVWQNEVEITDTSWHEIDLDISAVADGQETVYLRWTMGTTDVGWRYCGWNIDDIEIRAVPLFVPGDFDRDRDVDPYDLDHFRICGTGPSIPQNDPACQDADLDDDGDVDQEDFGFFQRCLSGPGILGDPHCAD